MKNKPMLIVWMDGNDLNKPKIRWEFGHNINSYFLIGVLEDIKQELVNQIDEVSKDET